VAYLDERRNRDGISYRIKYRIDGKEKVTTFTERAAAERWLPIFNAAGPAAALKMLNDEIDKALGVPTIRQVVEDHITNLTGVQDDTRDEYRREAERDIYPTLGDLPITSLAAAAPGWLNALSKRTIGDSDRTLSAKTITNRHSLLSGAAASAVRAGLLADNPCQGLKMPAGTHADMVILTPAEFRALRAHMPERWHPLTTLLVSTGLRWGEATALQIADIDLRASELHVRRAWKHRRRELGPPKSKAGYRTVAFGKPVAEAIAPLLKGRPASAFVFVTVNGTAVPNNSYHGNVWGPAVRDAIKDGELVRKPRVHDLRHSYASWTLGAGVPAIVVQRQMGHEKITTTVDRYGHLMPDARMAAAAAATAALAED
jgi:integrase